mmetsp:Transcript_21143/g.52408  ORF Transcript_21143/g.52408 Transcript_21143/m.52408 type:complete len:202 (-) Transcript_21143:188-793(-)
MASDGNRRWAEGWSIPTSSGRSTKAETCLGHVSGCWPTDWGFPMLVYTILSKERLILSPERSASEILSAAITTVPRTAYSILRRFGLMVSPVSRLLEAALAAVEASAGDPIQAVATRSEATIANVPFDKNKPDPFIDSAGFGESMFRFRLLVSLDCVVMLYVGVDNIVMKYVVTEMISFRRVGNEILPSKDDVDGIEIHSS